MEVILDLLRAVERLRQSAEAAWKRERAEMARLIMWDLSWRMFRSSQAMIS